MNILAIKGGGARGIIVTRFLVEIEKITHRPICDLFDYIGGSSVGALIACGILIPDENGNPKHTAEQMHEIFINDMVSAFSWTYSSWFSSVFGLIGPSYTNKGLLKITDDLCGDKKLGCLLKPIIFPAYDRIKHRAYYFDKEKDKDITLHNIIMSCTAAPIYFPSHSIEFNDETYDMVDGGIVVNNTAELVYLQATSNMQYIDKSKILELNIGTGTFTNVSTHKHGMLEWLPMIVNTLMHASNENELFELSLSLPKDNYYIMDIPLDIKYYDIDNIKKETIEYYTNETEKWIDINKTVIKEFCFKLMANKGYDMPDDNDNIDDFDDFDSAQEFENDMSSDDCEINKNIQLVINEYDSD